MGYWSTPKPQFWSDGKSKAQYSSACNITRESLITVDPQIMSGKPVFKGTRVPVQTLIEHLESGCSIDYFLDGFPSVSREQAIAAAELCSTFGTLHAEMVTEYIREAMKLPHYEEMENGRFFATIPGLQGLWAEEATLETCRAELRSTLEDWIALRLRFGDRLPVIGGVNLHAAVDEDDVKWVKQMEQDAASGKLDFLFEELIVRRKPASCSTGQRINED